MYSRMLWRVIRSIAINCKVPLCNENELNPPKNISTAFQPCPKRASWHYVSDSLVNTGESVDEDKAGDHSVMLPWTKNGTKASSESNFSQPSKNSLVTNNAFSSMMEHLAIRQKWQLSGSGNKTLKFWVNGQETPQTLIPLRTCGQSSRGGWTNKTPQILTNSKLWLWKNGLPSVRMWPRS